MSHKHEDLVGRDGVVPFPSPPGRASDERSPDRPDRRGAGAEPDLPGPWPVRVHVSEADRSELLNRIVGG